MKKFSIFFASLLVSVASFAQWTKPATPKAQALTVGAECYLFNIDAEGFLLGANDWGTRASVSPTLGHKVYIQNGTEAGSYYLTNYVLEGGMKDQIGYMFLDALDAVYVDNTIDGKKNNQYTFEDTGDHIYKIGLSPANLDFTDEMMCFLGTIPEKKDTRLYFCDPASEAYNYNNCQIRWIFASTADYEKYVAARKQYDAAMALGAVLDEAKAYAGVDYSAAQTVYNNTNSTVEQLNAAKEALEKAVREAKFNTASVSNPYDVLPGLGIATDFTDGTFNGWTSTTSASNKGAGNGNNAKDFSVTGNHYENWNGAPFTPGKISATAKDIPAGVYHLNALAFSNSGKDAFLYAGDSRTEVTATQIDVEKEFDVYTLVTTNSLEIGLDIPVKGPNWVGLDNVHLYLLGNNKDSYDFLTEKALATTANFDMWHEEGSLVCQNAAYDAYKTAKDDLQAATIENYAAAFKTFQSAAAALKANVEAYAAYVEAVENSKEWYDSTPVENEYTDLLGAYLNDDEADGYNGHGTSSNILEKRELSTEDIIKETEYLEARLYDAKTNSMSDGQDCTSFIVNANFSETGGWTAAQGINWPAGDTAVFPVFEAWGRVCDVYQDLTGLQNGVYELNAQAVYNVPGEEIRQTYVYINDYQTKIGTTTTEEMINDANGASAAFAEGKFPVTVYGIVTDGKMRLGIANRLRTNENGVLWAGGVKLTFRAKNEEALKSLIADAMPLANSMLDSKCGNDEINALEQAISDAETASSPADLYTAAINLKGAMDAIEEGVEVYKNLEVAIFNLEQTIENAPATADKTTIDAATRYFDDVKAKFDQNELNTEDAKAAIEKLNTYTVAIKLGKSIASEENPVDYSSAITNNTFDPTMGNKDEKRIDGWVVIGALNGYKQNTCSFNKGTFDLHQDLVGLPKGKYKVTVHTYYRAGSYEEEGANILAGKDTHLMKLYANSETDNFETNVMNLSEGSKDVTLPEGIGTRVINGITVPDGTSASAACYAAGLFLNELKFTVGDDGKATIGLKLDQTIGTNDYTVVGEWNLWYMGNPAPEVTEQDVTSLIVNNTFDPAKGNKDEKRIDGWEVSGALNGYKQNSCSFNKGTFDLHQNLSGLPKGSYKVTVHTYYRAGSYEEEEANILAGNDTHLMKLYANTEDDNFETSIMNLSEGSKDVTLPEGIGTRVINGITVPDGTGASVACFAAGLFLNELKFTVGDDGKATIGLKLDQTIGSNDYTVVGEWNLYYYGYEEPKELEESDVTSLIVNNTFDPAKGSKDEKRIDGWAVSGALNGYKQNSCSFNKGTFDLNQKLSGLPEGTYKVTVHTYYRAGSYEEEEANILAGNDTHLMKLYANTAEKNYITSIMNLSEGSKGVTLPDGIGTRVINGITVPDGTSASVACFAEGLFLNELPFYVGNDGTVTIGLKLDQTIGSNDYTVVGEWNLYYYGSGNHVSDVPTSIEEVEIGESIKPVAVPVAYYNINGQRQSGLVRGINIVKMSDGSALKIMVK